MATAGVKGLSLGTAVQDPQLRGRRAYKGVPYINTEKENVQTNKAMQDPQEKSSSLKSKQETVYCLLMNCEPTFG